MGRGSRRAAAPVFATKPRAAKRKRAAIKRVEHGSGAGAGGTQAQAIRVGPMTVDRIVDDKYEWRDGGLKRRRMADRDAARVWDPGIT